MYYYNDCLYTRCEPTNAFTYSGKPETVLVMDHVEKALDEYSLEHFTNIYVSEEGYHKLTQLVEQEKMQVKEEAVKNSQKIATAPRNRVNKCPKCFCV